MHSYEDLIGTHPGECAFVVGAGTSLYPISKRKDFYDICKHVVISVNSSIILFPWESGLEDKRYWISTDSAVRGWTYWKKVKRCKAHRLVRTSWKKHYWEIPTFYCYPPRPTKEDVVIPGDKGLAYCGSTVGGIDLAIQMGCKKIFLLGIDNYFKGGKTHFWQFWDRKDQPKGFVQPRTQQKSLFDFTQNVMKALNKYAEHEGAKIYNVSADSEVKAFSKIGFDKVWEIINRKE